MHSNRYIPQEGGHRIHGGDPVLVGRLETPGWTTVGRMSAQPVDDFRYDPQVILEALPVQWREVFLAEYEQAVNAARQPEQFRALYTVLRRWALQAERYANPAYEHARQAARSGSDGVGVEQAHPVLASLIDQERARRAG